MSRFGRTPRLGIVTSDCTGISRLDPRVAPAALEMTNVDGLEYVRTMLPAHQFRGPVSGLPPIPFMIVTLMPLTPQTLLIDADDTLWENNVYFEQAIAEFIERLNHQHLSPQDVRLFLNQVERETIMERGYGSHSFAHSLVKCFERLSEAPVTPALHEFVWGFAHKVSTSPLS
jgi:hypothetical protein